MKPSLEELSKIKDYNYAPVMIELLSDEYTVINVLKNLKAISKKQFLFESALVNSWGRYSFLGFDPKLEIKAKNYKVKIIKDNTVNEFDSKNPLDEINNLIKDYKSASFDDFPSFTGGLVGYISYDSIKYYNKIELKAKDIKNNPDYHFMLFEDIICFDNYKNKIYLITNIKLDSNLKSNYEKAKARLERLKISISSDLKYEIKQNKIYEELKSTVTYSDYEKNIKKIKDYIIDGDIFQCVYSRAFKGKMKGSLFNTYRILRTINPSPYMVYIDTGESEVIASSPETLIKKDNNELYTYPIAGSRKRGKDLEEDLELEKDLLSDEKELAEHNMLVDLGRNDIGKISKIGSVNVIEYMKIKKYSHIMHISSTVKGIAKDNLSPMEIICSLLPAGTLSGAPKLRSMEIIDELEIESRGLYGGAIGYIDFRGNLDMAIAIRCAYKTGDDVYVQSGGGIVLDSVAKLEFEESENKAKALIKAFKESEGDANGTFN